MAKIILSINAGSSSVKVSVYRIAERGHSPEQIVETQVAGLTAPPAAFSYQSRSRTIKKQELDDGVKGQDGAFKYMLDQLVADKEGAPDIQRREDIVAACHRIVHGGDFEDAQLITPETYHQLEALSDLAPLHNAPALSIVHSCLEHLPRTKNIACFDSAFHHTLPDHVRIYPIDPEVAAKNKLRKYGFHGISYSFILRSVAAYLGKPVNETSIIALHLGSGASACAIRNGQSVDTSMGLTPLAGLPGATRSGSIDPSLVFHFTSDAGKPSPSSTKDMHISTAEEILNKQSGWKALTGTTDFGTIVSHAHSSSSSPEEAKKFQLAFSIFVDRIAGFVGSYFVQLQGQVDALVFAGGIGEKSAELRSAVLEKAECLGFKLDQAKNEKPTPGETAPANHEDDEGAKSAVTSIAPDHGKDGKETLVCWTDEQVQETFSKSTAIHPSPRVIPSRFKHHANNMN